METNTQRPPSVHPPAAYRLKPLNMMQRKSNGVIYACDGDDDDDDDDDGDGDDGGGEMQVQTVFVSMDDDF